MPFASLQLHVRKKLPDHIDIFNKYLVRQLLDFIQYGIYWSASFTSSGEWHNAVTAHVITATHDRPIKKSELLLLNYYYGYITREL